MKGNETLNTSQDKLKNFPRRDDEAPDPLHIYTKSRGQENDISENMFTNSSATFYLFIGHILNTQHMGVLILNPVMELRKH